MNELSTLNQGEKVSGYLTVSELTGIIKNLIEESFPVIGVTGEISNFVNHSSGHKYFTLKDDSSQIKCVMFRWQAEKLDFVPAEGAKVKVVGNLTVYERSGQYQMNVIRLMPAGKGELFENLEKLKKKLAEEGVFDNNRPLPLYPMTVGIITSPTGAAVHDMINVISRRAPYVKIILRPSLVQGVAAAPDIIRAINELNEIEDVDVIIVGRGGGSIEDLWCFNEESVARAIASSRIPVISAVGHETDITLADFAADLRAPTPSAAAELVVRDVFGTRDIITGLRESLRRNLIKSLDNFSLRLSHVRKDLRPEKFLNTVYLRSQEIDELSSRLRRGIIGCLSDNDKKIAAIKLRLGALNPKAVLGRGYSIVYKSLDNSIITDETKVKSGEVIKIELSKGKISAKVE